MITQEIEITGFYFEHPVGSNMSQYHVTFRYKKVSGFKAFVLNDAFVNEEKESMTDLVEQKCLAWAVENYNG